MNPKVSICIPTYNFARYLPEAIESVLVQTYADYELLIIDDCSTDNSRQIIDKYAQQDKRIVVQINDSNKGMVNNWNLCLYSARGEYVKFLFADDTLYSDSTLEKMVSVLDADGEIALVASARKLINEKSLVIGVLTEYRDRREYLGTDIIQDCLIEQKNKIGEPSAVLFRRRHAMRGFDGRYRQAVDLEMWFHILEQGKFAYINEPLCSFRIHEGQQTKINLERIDLYAESFQLLQSYANKSYLHLSSIQREYMYYVPLYSIWKLYKKGKISQKTAVEEIKKHSSISKFKFRLPLYRFYKFVKRLKKKIFRKIVMP